VRSWLEPQQWTVTEAESGQAALERLAEEQPDLILLDLMMPDMDGFQLVTKLSNEPSWRNIPVIIVTAHDITTDDRRRLNSAVEAILLKGSFAPAQLVEHIRQLLRPPARPDSLSGALS